LSDEITVPSGEESLVQERMREITDLANRSSAVVYTMDTRGLPTLLSSPAGNVMGLPPIDASAPTYGSSRGQIPGLAMSRSAAHFESQWPMAYLASQTGGIFVHDNNDLAGGMRQIVDDLTGYYLIGYKPPADT